MSNSNLKEILIKAPDGMMIDMEVFNKAQQVVFIKEEKSKNMRNICLGRYAGINLTTEELMLCIKCEELGIDIEEKMSEELYEALQKLIAPYVGLPYDFDYRGHIKRANSLNEHECFLYIKFINALIHMSDELDKGNTGLGNRILLRENDKVNPIFK